MKNTSVLKKWVNLNHAPHDIFLWAIEWLWFVKYDIDLVCIYICIEQKLDKSEACRGNIKIVE